MIFRPTKKTLTIALGVATLTALGLGLHAGVMEPWGPPGPTMKPLFEIEPRQVLWGAWLLADQPLRIETPGSYYLAEDIDATGKQGILITASNVTIDLNGFSLRGGTGDGIAAELASPRLTNIVIKNGAVEGWGGYGIGISLYYADSSRVLNVRAEGNYGGITVGHHGQVVDSIAANNVEVGILGLTNTLVSRCNAVSNSNGGGIQVDAGSSVTHCVANQNGFIGIHGLTSDVKVTDSVATGNGHSGISAPTNSLVANCQASQNNGAGIVLRSGSITNCVVGPNEQEGIYVVSEAFVSGNVCSGSGPTPSPGIYAEGANNRIEANHVTGWARGIEAYIGDNIIVGNTLVENTTNFDVAAGNFVPTFVIGSSGSPDTWANLCRGNCP